jgi:uncharacterized RDD family membrane protein YckC
MLAMMAWPRIKAFLYDYLIILCWMLVMIGMGLFLTKGPLADWWAATISTPERLDLVAFFVTILPVMIYFIVAESSQVGGSWGKRRIGLRVVDMKGERLSVTRALVRSAVKFTPWQLAHTAVMHISFVSPGAHAAPEWATWLLIGMWVLVGIFALGLTKFAGHRTIYDRLSGSRVVVAEPS